MEFTLGRIGDLLIQIFFPSFVILGSPKLQIPPPPSFSVPSRSTSFPSDGFNTHGDRTRGLSVVGEAPPSPAFHVRDAGATGSETYEPVLRPRSISAQNGRRGPHGVKGRLGGQVKRSGRRRRQGGRRLWRRRRRR